jgi:hypothetical protein
MTCREPLEFGKGKTAPSSCINNPCETGFYYDKAIKRCRKCYFSCYTCIGEGN